MNTSRYKSPYWIGFGFSLSRSTEGRGWTGHIAIGRWSFEWWSK